MLPDELRDEDNLPFLVSALALTSLITGIEIFGYLAIGVYFLYIIVLTLLKSKSE